MYISMHIYISIYILYIHRYIYIYIHIYIYIYIYIYVCVYIEIFFILFLYQVISAISSLLFKSSLSMLLSKTSKCNRTWSHVHPHSTQRGPFQGALSIFL